MYGISFTTFKLLKSIFVVNRETLLDYLENDKNYTGELVYDRYIL